MTISVAGTPVTTTAIAASSIAATLPASISVGDLLRINVSQTPDSGSITTPSGWTKPQDVADGFGGGRLSAFWRIADGTEGATVSFTFANARNSTAIAWRLTGHNPTTPIDASANNSGTTGSTTAITSPSVTTTVANCMIERSGATRQSTGIADPGGGYTNVSSATNGSSFDQNAQRVSYIAQAGTGASGTADFVSSGTDREWQAITIAIAPAPGPTPTLMGQACL